MSTAIFTIAFCVTVMAGTWKSDANGWWFDEGNGSYPKNKWSWIDGNNDGVSECYYFDQNGYCLINTITPDNFYVNINGAWTVDGTTQTKSTGTTVSHSSGNNVDVVTERVTIGENKNKKNKSKSKSKSSKKNQDEDEDDYDDEDEIENEDEDDSEEESKKKSSKKSDGKKVNFTNNMDMFDLKTESSKDFRDYSPGQSLRGESWEGCKLCENYWGSYAEYYIGGNYKKLTLKATPCTFNNNFAESGAAHITISNAETGEELCTKRITHATKIETITADITDVEYVRIDCDQTSNTGCTYVLLKDAILTK